MSRFMERGVGGSILPSNNNNDALPLKHKSSFALAKQRQQQQQQQQLVQQQQSRMLSNGLLNPPPPGRSSARALENLEILVISQAASSFESSSHGGNHATIPGRWTNSNSNFETVDGQSGENRMFATATAKNQSKKSIKARQRQLPPTAVLNSKPRKMIDLDNRPIVLGISKLHKKENRMEGRDEKNYNGVHNKSVRETNDGNVVPDTCLPLTSAQPHQPKVLEERIELVAMEDSEGTPFIRILMSKNTTTVGNSKLPPPPIVPPTSAKQPNEKKSVKAKKRRPIPFKVVVPVAHSEGMEADGIGTTTAESVAATNTEIGPGVEEGSTTVASTTTKKNRLAANLAKGLSTKIASIRGLPKMLPRKRQTQLEDVMVAGQESSNTDKVEAVVAATETKPSLIPADGNISVSTPQRQLQLRNAQRAETLKKIIAKEKQELLAQKQYEKFVLERLQQQKRQEHLEKKLQKQQEEKQQEELPEQKPARAPVMSKFKAAMEQYERQNKATSFAMPRDGEVTDTVHVIPLDDRDKAERSTAVSPIYNNEDISSIGVSESTGISDNDDDDDGFKETSTCTASVSTGFDTDIDDNDISSVNPTQLDRLVDSILQSFARKADVSDPDDDEDEYDDYDFIDMEEDDYDDYDEEKEDDFLSEELELNIPKNHRGVIRSPNASRMDVTDEMIMQHTNTWASALGWDEKDPSNGRGEDDERDLRIVESDDYERDLRMMDSRDDDDDEDDDDDDEDDSGSSYDEEDLHTINTAEDDGLDVLKVERSVDNFEEKKVENGSDDERMRVRLGNKNQKTPPHKQKQSKSRHYSRYRPSSTGIKDDDTSVDRAMKKFRVHAQRLGIEERELIKAMIPSPPPPPGAVVATQGGGEEDFFSDEFMRKHNRIGYA
ncbi:hypothetical protein IV203_032104 [Nitzschia inconspicua]|uniref:Uncharacterized protein n=1 Tax=Nitzschia inconspicua TaxID=303405 RepID=A0A9K3LZB0_9STRA|nr:hypothetical protein IV203_032104 [Nitzschia inconspicua]